MPGTSTKSQNYPGITFLRHLATLVILGTLAALPARALAAPQLVVEAGYEGYAPWWAWMPVRVVLSNPDAEEFRGILEVRDRNRNQVLLTRSQTVQVPPRSTRTLLFWVPSTDDLDHDVRLLQEGRLVAERASRPTSSTLNCLRGLPGRPPTSLPRPLESIPVQVVHLDPVLLPRQSSPWFGFDALIIDGSSALRPLDDQQVRALHQ